VIGTIVKACFTFVRRLSRRVHWAVPAIALGLVACTPAQSAVWSQIEQTVLIDVENGSALSAIEAAVVALDPSLAGDAAAADRAIQAAIEFLESVGAIPKESVPYAESLKLQAALKLAASGLNSAQAVQQAVAQ
jgi:hypothetical protein